jgi:hypothetical protein
MTLGVDVTFATFFAKVASPERKEKNAKVFAKVASSKFPPPRGHGPGPKKVLMIPSANLLIFLDFPCA